MKTAITQNLKSVITGYLDAALHLAEDMQDEDIEDFSMETKITAIEDCMAILQLKDTAWIGSYSSATEEERDNMTKYVKNPHQIGCDFWLTRNGHGAGFWDRELGRFGDAITASAERFKTLDVVVGDDGQLYLEG